MVEGDSVHRVATRHRERLIGKKFKAWSPNGRFKEGATLIDGKPFSRIEAVGKNLFAFFGDANDERNLIVMHVHFGMAGNWAVYEDRKHAPEPSKTNRLRLEHLGLVADLSAMTVEHGKMALYYDKRNKLGEDPLRDDADPKNLWARIQKSNKSIGALIMDQSYFAGPGNIYRCEILFKAGVHPDKVGKHLHEDEFNGIWHHAVALLKLGYETGSSRSAKALGKPKMRRYIYNSAICPRCGSSIKTWPINNRTCYACNNCQPLDGSKGAVVTSSKDCVPFNSHCAQESAALRLRETGPSRLTVNEIKRELIKLEVKWQSSAKKAELAELLENSRDMKPALVSPEAAASSESLAIEHFAEFTPGQARLARSRVLEFKDEDQQTGPDEVVSNLTAKKMSGLKSEREKAKCLDRRNHSARKDGPD